MRPQRTPIGLLLTRTAKAVGQAFEDSLAEAGGSTSIWLILLALMQGVHRTQEELASAVGVRGPTLTHHLNGMEAAGLLSRSRRPANRRVHEVALTERGRALFHRLRGAAAAHDARLRRGFAADELETLRGMLGRLGMAAGKPGPGEAAEAGIGVGEQGIKRAR
jgi:MarR family transcriptional regulator for hemolysin